MPSEKQIAANQRNAQHSTGPRTEAGKAASRFNNVRHALTGQLSIVPPSRQAEFAAIESRLTASLNPVGEEELQIAARMVRATWRLSQVSEHVDNIYAMGLIENGQEVLLQKDVNPADTGFTEEDFARAVAFRDARTFLQKVRDFNLIGVYEHRIHRALMKDRDLLTKLQTARRQQESRNADTRDAESRNAAPRKDLAAPRPLVMTAAASSNGFGFSPVWPAPPSREIRPEFAAPAPFSAYAATQTSQASHSEAGR